MISLMTVLVVFLCSLWLGLTVIKGNKTARALLAVACLSFAILPFGLFVRVILIGIQSKFDYSVPIALAITFLVAMIVFGIIPIVATIWNYFKERRNKNVRDS